MLALLIDNHLPWFGDLLQLGGNILLVIFLIAGLLWLLICERWLFLWLTYPALARQANQLWAGRMERRSWYAQQYRLGLLCQVQRALDSRLGLISILIKLCPLAGLLGTVLGMLEVFDAVAATGANNPRATAAGVSKATISTMAGMVVAISGLLFAGVLNRRVEKERSRLRDDLTLDAKRAGQS